MSTDVIKYNIHHIYCKKGDILICLKVLHVTINYYFFKSFHSCCTCSIFVISKLDYKGCIIRNSTVLLITLNKPIDTSALSPQKKKKIETLNHTYTHITYYYYSRGMDSVLHRFRNSIRNSSFICSYFYKQSNPHGHAVGPEQRISQGYGNYTHGGCDRHPPSC